MPAVKYTVKRGQVNLADVAVAAGTAEAQSDTLSVNIDYNRLSKADAMMLLEKVTQKLHAGSWPPLA